MSFLTDLFASQLWIAMALGLYGTLACFVLFVLVLGADKMGAFARKNKFPVAGRTVLITGGSQGTGRSAGRLLASKGANVIIVARNVEKLEAALAYISEGAIDKKTQRFHYISANLMDPSVSPRIIAEATAWNSSLPLDIVWCCHGSAHPTLFVDTPASVLKAQMDSNYLSAAYLAQATLQSWLTPASVLENGYAVGTPALPSRHLIFTSSFVAFLTIAGYASYSPSKAALRSLSDTLSMEMKLYEASYLPMAVHTVFPATIFSEGYEEENKVKSDITKKLEEDDGGQTPEEVAKWSVMALERGDELITTTWLTRAVMCGVLGASRRNGVPLLDTVIAWIVSVVLVFVRMDLDTKVREWGARHGVSGMKGQLLNAKK